MVLKKGFLEDQVLSGRRYTMSGTIRRVAKST
jgi:hypothetical protein